jgi:hypothetical protein
MSLVHKKYGTRKEQLLEQLETDCLFKISITS